MPLGPGCSYGRPARRLRHPDLSLGQAPLPCKQLVSVLPDPAALVKHQFPVAQRVCLWRSIWLCCRGFERRSRRWWWLGGRGVTELRLLHRPSLATRCRATPSPLHQPTASAEARNECAATVLQCADEKKRTTDGSVMRVCWRRGPESNRARRICNPLHNRFATAPCMVPYPL